MPVDKASDGAELRKLIAQLRPETVRACNAVFVLYGDRRPRPKEIIEIADIAGARHEPVCAVFGYVRHCLAKTLIWESVHGPPANGRSVMAYLDDRDREWAIAFAIHDRLWPHRLKIIGSFPEDRWLMRTFTTRKRRTSPVPTDPNDRPQQPPRPGSRNQSAYQ